VLGELRRSAEGHQGGDRSDLSVPQGEPRTRVHVRVHGLDDEPSEIAQPLHGGERLLVVHLQESFATSFVPLLDHDHPRVWAGNDTVSPPGGEPARVVGSMASLPSSRGFDDAYVGVPPWDIGRPQRAVVALAEAGAFRSPVLDVGCGTGENALALASTGLPVLGIDASPRAIGKSMEKARDRRLASAEFLVADAFALEGLGRRFGSVLDCGLFHVFDDHERPVYAASVHAALEPGGELHVLCFADREPPGWGPRRVSEGELRSTFVLGWEIREIAPASFETNLDSGDVHAWLARFVRT
jgi:SAM-dependent methyltransferase